MLRDLGAIALCLLAALVCVPSAAEIRVVTDRWGDYSATRVMLGSSRSGRGHVWTPLRRGNPAHVLNPRGDQNGDLWPTVRESNLQPHHPWVVWSRLSPDSQYDLAWSHWSNGAWRPIGWISRDSDRLGDDLDPDIVFGHDGRPFVTWWRNEGGTGRVYVSLYDQVAREWSKAQAVSDLGDDSRFPTVDVLGPGGLLVRYTTERGIVSQIVDLSPKPVAITDDINPLDNQAKPETETTTELQH